MTGHTPIIIVSAYLSCNKAIPPRDLETLFNLGNAVIIAGDLNSKHREWGNVRNNRNGISLSNLSELLNFAIIAPNDPTRYDTAERSDNTTHNPSVIDLALTKNISLNISIETIHELNSDHRPVKIALGNYNPFSTCTKKIIDYKLLADNIENLDSSHLDQIPDIIDSANVALKAASHLTDHLVATIGKSSREMPTVHEKRWPLPGDIRESIRLRNAAKRTYDRYPSEEYRKTLRHYEREVKYKIKQHKAEQWDRLLSELEPTHTAYWPLAKHFKNKTESDMPPLIRPNGPPALEDVDKAECLANTIEEQCRLSTIPTCPSHIDNVNKVVLDRLSKPPEEPLRPVDAEEIKDIIKCLNSKKAPGPDGISNKTLKLLPPILIQLLVNIFNALLMGCSFPDIWKVATIIGIHKPGKPRREPSSYRPISLLSCLGKVYERVIMRRLKDVIIDKKLLPDEQFAFRELHSCPAQVHRLTEYIVENKNNRTSTCAVFFDIAKAFDKIWHNGLLFKLIELGIPDSLIILISNYLKNRKFRFRVEGTLSSLREIEAGVPQGSVLSPSLYNLYTCDIPVHPRVQKGMFADDTTLYYAHKRVSCASKHLQKAVTDLGNWFSKWRIEVNPDKSQAIQFNKTTQAARVNQRMSPISLHGNIIPEVKKVKYLGVVLNKSMTFSSHVTKTIQKAKFVLYKLYPLLNPRSKMSLRHKLTLYKTCIRTILTYACVSFAHISDSQMDRLQKVQNRFLRLATGAPRYLRNIDLHSDCELITIKSYIKELAERFFSNNQNHPNPLIRRALDYEHDAQTFRYPFRRPKHILADPVDPITKHVTYTVQLRKHKSHAPARPGLHRGRRRRRPRGLDTITRSDLQTDPDTGPNPNPSSSSPPSQLGTLSNSSRDRDVDVESSTNIANFFDIRTYARVSTRPSAEGERDGPLSTTSDNLPQSSSTAINHTTLAPANACVQPHSSESE